MSKKRFSNSKSTTGGRVLKSRGFIGVCLGGGKSEKTALAYLEYFPDQRKIFLSDLITKIKSDGDISSDLVLYEAISRHKKRLESVAFNVALSFPKCVVCKLQCPGYEICDEDEILWLWDHYRKNIEPNKNRKIFTPYTERCVDLYVAHEWSEIFQLSSALGANMAPLTARAHYLNRRIRSPVVEVFPRLSVYKIGKALNLTTARLMKYKHQSYGVEAREIILQSLAEHKISFFYEQDLRLLSQSAEAFDAYICALTAVLQFTNQCEKRPKDFPKKENWIAIPKDVIIW